MEQENNYYFSIAGQFAALMGAISLLKHYQVNCNVASLSTPLLTSKNEFNFSNISSKLSRKASFKSWKNSFYKNRVYIVVKRNSSFLYYNIDTNKCIKVRTYIKDTKYVI